MNKAFRFRLDAALQQRVRQEQTIQVALSRTMHGRDVALAGMDQMQQQIAETKRGAALPGMSLDMDGRMNLLFFLDRAAQRLQQQRSLVAQWEQEVRRVQELLRQASARRKALERLRERRAHEYYEQEQRRVERELDELVTLRFTRSLEPGKEADARLFG